MGVLLENKKSLVLLIKSLILPIIILYLVLKYLSHSYLSLSSTKSKNLCRSFSCIFISFIPS
nr:MAG TPA: hypothetical protein [Bacteriophage sp.]